MKTFSNSSASLHGTCGTLHIWVFPACLLLWVSGLVPHVHAQQFEEVIDSGRYANAAAASAAWEPMFRSETAAVTTVEGVSALWLRCPFARKPLERASWDRRVQLDLSTCRGIEFRFLCRDAAPVSHFSLYLESGAGWYSTTFFPETTGWNTIRLDKAAMESEGVPEGWSTIKTIRISAWRGGDTDTEFFVSDLRKFGQLGVDTLVALVRCDSAAKERHDDARSVAQFTATVASALEKAGVGYATLSDVNLTSEMLSRARLVILPHNPTMPERTVDEVIRYLRSGGRLLTFYGMPARLRPVVKIEAKGFARPASPGEFSAMRFVSSALPGAPLVVGQASWNILEPRAVPGASRVVAEWLDQKGRPTGHAAVVASSNCVEMSHVLLGDDPANKRQMLLSMAGYLVPAIWKQVTDHSLDGRGRVAGYRDFADALSQMGDTAHADPRIQALLSEARRLHQGAAQLRTEGRFAEAFGQAEDATNRLLDAYYRSQRPLKGEFRAFWCHGAFGVDGMDWDTAIDRLAANGFTAIMPNMFWGGVAYYDSKVLPVAREVATRGDQIARCLEACKKHGLQIHIWKVNWNLGDAPGEFVDRMRREGRMQASSSGKEELWLCPSHPDNQRLEIESMVEVARRYDVDGLHFDYIRYPDGDHCFCAGCKRRFEHTLGSAIDNWPGDALEGGSKRHAWLDWRRGNITTVVKAVSEQARAVKPGVKLSAAVFRNWPMDRDSIGQDWKLWCACGYLDFVCPMDYTSSQPQFENWVKHQRLWAGPAVCYPGIGAWILSPDRVIGQIQATRRLGTSGFVLFNYDAAAEQTLVPLLGKGITRRPESDPTKQ